MKFEVYYLIYFSGFFVYFENVTVLDFYQLYKRNGWSFQNCYHLKEEYDTSYIIYFIIDKLS